MSVKDRRAHNLLQARVFNREAPLFQQPIPNDVLQRLKLAVREAHLEPGYRVLDVGTGVGVLLPFILAHRPSHVVACDLSFEMLRCARETFGTSVRFIKTDVVDLSPKKGPFDAVFCNACFGNFHDQTEAVRAISRLLKPGGHLVISHPLGRQFVLQLKKESRELDLHELPPTAEITQNLFDVGSLRLTCFRDDPFLYLAIGQKEG